MPTPRTPAKFLLVDDIEENLLVLEAALQRDGLEVHKASSGPEALELLLVHEFALALVDVQMPEMDGFQLAELMRDNERTRRIPLIFITAGGRDAARTFQGYEAGAVDFLFKPIDTRILRHKVDVFLELFLQRAELAETLRLNEELLAIVTHDLRSPLASIQMNAGVLATQTYDAGVRKHAERIRRSSRQLIGIVNELLDLSRARLAGGIPIDRRDLDLGALATRIVSDVSETHAERKITLTTTGDLVGRWDGPRLEQVLMNLIGNAIHHGKPASPVEVSVVDRSDDVDLTVRNEGTIPAEALPRIFEPFQQGYAKRKSGGLGLGLYIVDQIVLAHGGAVTVTTSGAATAFSVRLSKRSTTPLPA